MRLMTAQKLIADQGVNDGAKSSQEVRSRVLGDLSVHLRRVAALKSQPDHTTKTSKANLHQKPLPADHSRGRGLREKLPGKDGH